MSIIIPSNSIVSGGFSVDNSVRLDNNAYLNRTFSGGTQTKFTLSAWIKRSAISTQQTIMSRYVTANKYVKILINNANQLEYGVYNNNQGGYQARYETSALFRDTSAWYHIVVAQDSSLGTAADRVKFYVNGELITSFGTNTQIGQNVTGDFNGSGSHQIGAYNGGDEFQGYFSQICFVDNAQYNPTSFAEFDEDSGIWKPIDVSGLSTGGTSFFLDFEDSSALGNDAAGSNNFTVNNLTAIDQSTDTCTNNGATLNNNDVMRSGTSSVFTPIFSEGNLKMSDTATNNYSAFGSIAVETGKWYWEMKIPNYDPNLGNRIGLFYGNNKAHSGSYYNGSNGFLIHQNGSIYTSGASTAYMATFSDNIIITFALDRTNGLSYVGAGGSWADGNGNTNQSFANAVAVQTKLSITMINDITFPFFDVYGNTSQLINFGSPSFAISSGNADGNGYGNFEYTVPDGYYALNTKNLAEYG